MRANQPVLCLDRQKSILEDQVLWSSNFVPLSSKTVQQISFKIGTHSLVTHKELLSVSQHLLIGSHQSDRSRIRRPYPTFVVQPPPLSHKCLSLISKSDKYSSTLRILMPISCPPRISIHHVQQTAFRAEICGFRRLPYSFSPSLIFFIHFRPQSPFQSIPLISLCSSSFLS
ncbi:hypothetical protein BLNAU_24688 [Blattamonas nauphoetae]|uniref:Uncharacterized protein n=1 Tax=Blattamonas nauphoetae TaxID=2049346 RepID=A0ABQ9WM43_9EUKA|nr:hypothetical protein BLNAU_24688 [Blattamonas nauphoetae]